MVNFAQAIPALRRIAGKRQVRPVGFNLGLEHLHMVQMEQVSGHPVIRAAASVPYPCEREALLASPALFKHFVKQALRAGQFAGKRVVACIAPYELKLMLVEYKQLDGQGEADALLKELRERMRQELDESVVDYLPLRNTDTQETAKSAIVAVAKRAQVLAYLELLRRAGLEAVALDIGPAALTRLVATLDTTSSHPNVLLINFGRFKSYLSVIWGRRLMLDREIDFGEHWLVANVAENLDIPGELVTKLLYEHGFQNTIGDRPELEDGDISRTMAEILRPEFAELAKEINKTLIYVASRTHGKSVEQVYLLGSAARYPHVAEFLNELLKIPVEVLNPLNAFEFAAGAAPNDPNPGGGIALAAGLALRGMIADE